jgi:hypothetical protein
MMLPLEAFRSSWDLAAVLEVSSTRLCVAAKLSPTGFPVGYLGDIIDVDNNGSS